MRQVLIAVLLLTLAGCDRSQPWTFRNGTGLDDTRPPIIVAEVYAGGECGFACQPPGQRVHCEEIGEGAQGRPPPGLDDGTRYCFLGTALDEAGNAYAIGCAVAEVGGEAIDVALSPIEEGRIIRRRCQDVPEVRFDAGAPGMDAGPMSVDAGPIGRDAGPMGVDAGPPLPPDAGPAVDFRRPVTVTFQVSGPGRVGVFDEDGRLMSGDYIYDRQRLWVEAWVGFYTRIEAMPQTGATIQTIDVPHCGDTSPCEFVYARSETIDIVFAP